MRQRSFASRTSSLIGVSAGNVLRKYLVGSSSSLGHSTSNHCPSAVSVGWAAREAQCTRIAAKRDDKAALVPSRHVTVRKRRDGNCMASSFACRGAGACGGGLTAPATPTTYV